MSWKRSDYPKLAPVSLEAGPPLTWGMLVRGMCRVYQECGCPLADPESVKPVENPEPAQGVWLWRGAGSGSTA